MTPPDGKEWNRFMRRLRLQDYRLSDGPRQIGVSQGDIVGCAQAVNAACERLRYDKVFGDEGPPGSWAEVAISVDAKNPYVSCPYGVNSLAAIDVCKHPIPLSNSFAEYLLFGTGHMPKCDRWEGLGRRWRRSAGYQRNFSCTLTDLSDEPQQILVAPLALNDCVPNPNTGAVARVLIQGTCKGQPIYTTDGLNTVQGEYVTVTQPYAVTVNTFDQLTGIQKDPTQGPIQILQQDPWWGTQELLSVMEPGETTGWYRRYYLEGLPPCCCPVVRCCRINPVGDNFPSPPCPSLAPYARPEPRKFAEVTALARLDLIPATQDSDYLLIQSLEAIKLECMAGYMYGMQDAGSKAQAAAYHKQAIEILIGQSYADEGKNAVAANIAIFGNAGWHNVALGMT
jgi:hypothetical protein